MAYEFMLAAFTGVMLVCTLIFIITGTVPRICPGHRAWLIASVSLSFGMLIFTTLNAGGDQNLAVFLLAIFTVGWATGIYRGLLRFLYIPQDQRLLFLFTLAMLALLAYCYYDQADTNHTALVGAAYLSTLFFYLAFNIYRSKPVCCQRILSVLAWVLLFTSMYFAGTAVLSHFTTLSSANFLFALALSAIINLLLASLTVHQLLNQLESSEADALDFAAHDPLTDLFNRSGFEMAFNKKVTALDLQEQLLVIMFLDLDGFKQINEKHGYETGQFVLQTVAQRLQTQTNTAKDIVARFDEDEFAIILQFNANTVRQHILRQIANRLLKSLSRPISDGINTYQINANIGISQYPTNTCELAEFLDQANNALQQAKRQGNNNLRFWVPEQHTADKHLISPLSLSAQGH
ncbi:MAG: diguanylate cyclase domain-containing protein [Thiolinea sp.]